jgi:hypothetical protein
VVIGVAKPDLRGKELVRKVEYEKTPDGKETLKVTVSASGHGGQGSCTPVDQQPSEPSLARPVIPVEVTGQTGVPPGRPRMIKPSRPEIGNLKINIVKNPGSGPKPKVTFVLLFDKYSKQKAVTSDWPFKKRMRSPTHQGGSSSPPRAAIRLKGESSQQGQRFTPPWASSSSSAPHPVYDDNGVMWVPYQQAFHPGWSGHKSAFERISRPIQDRLAPRRAGQGYQTRPVRPVAVTGQTGAARKAAPPPIKEVYKPKQREEVQKMEVDPERTTSQDIIQIGSIDVSIAEDGKIPIVPNNKV